MVCWKSVESVSNLMRFCKQTSISYLLPLSILYLIPYYVYKILAIRKLIIDPRP
jgi:hypothetical protein